MLQTDTLPNNPGCYIYKDENGSVIYVGKAKNIRKRVSSYFTKNNHDEKTKLLVKNIATVDFIVTDSEVEALLLENNLIKKHLPKYNINLRDSKRFAYLLLTDERYPRLILARDRNLKGEYFGPFVSGQNRDLVQDLVIKSFKLRTCRKLPKKECLRYHIGLCSAPCIKDNHEEYMGDVSYARDVLSGKIGEVINNLKLEMKKLSSQGHFETAIIFRDRISALNYLMERQKSERDVRYDQDIIAYQLREGHVYLLIFHSHKGILDEKEEFVFEASDNFLEQFFIQYYSENMIPKEIISFDFPDEIEGYLEKISGKKVLLTIPKIGEKKQLLELANKNIDLVFFSEEEKLSELQNHLKLRRPPYVIECFDISHLSGTNTVASMVRFRNGRPDKENYRRFRIRSVEGIDDFSSMREVVNRRYSRLLKEGSELPDLIVIDGGKGQLHSAMDALIGLGLRLPIIGLAKREEEVFVPGLDKPLLIPKNNKGLLLLMAIRDEAHRFAINYNKALRSKNISDELKSDL